jgi:hypothetical protein
MAPSAGAGVCTAQAPAGGGQRGAAGGGARGDDAVLPVAVSGACGIIGGLLVFHLEMMNKPLYDEHGRAGGRGQEEPCWIEVDQLSC